MLHQIRSYLRFLWKSSNQHGVHSPFVYQLVTRCFYDRKSYPAYALLSRYRKSLRSNKESIKVNDLGSGSRVFTSEERKIASIAKNAGLTPKRARLLNRLVRYLETENALELGTSLGLGTAALATGNKVRVQTIEGCAATAAVAEENFRKFGLENIELKVGEFDEVLDELLDGKDGPKGTRSRARKSVAVAAVGKIVPEERSSTGAMSDEKLTNESVPKGAVLKKEQSRETGRREKVPQNEVPEASSRTLGKSVGGFSEHPAGGSFFNSSEENFKQRAQVGTEATNSCGTVGTAIPEAEICKEKPLHSYSLVYFDGNHQKEATLRYFERLLPYAHNDSVFIFDDIHWSEEMEEAWEQIKAHPSVRVSIDTFQWGLVFFRREQEEEHFVIRV